MGSVKELLIGLVGLGLLSSNSLKYKSKHLQVEGLGFALKYSRKKKRKVKVSLWCDLNSLTVETYASIQTMGGRGLNGCEVPASQTAQPQQELPRRARRCQEAIGSSGKPEAGPRGVDATTIALISE